MSTTDNNHSEAAKKDPSEKEEEDPNGIHIAQSFPPSHILQDGRFIFLPPPSPFERSKFFERSIAKFGLLESDMKTQEQEEEEEDVQKKDDDATTPKVHPLAVASARLQAAGIAELNRAINLSTLVNTGEYFGLTNIVDPSLELVGTAAAKPKGDPKDPNKPGGNAPNSKAPTAPASTAPVQAKELQEEQRVKNAYVLKRKRAVFDKASRVLQRHQTRLQEARVAQAVPDKRLRQLRTQWRLVAPEHGTRAKPHAVRPTEVVAVDVDVYDPTGGGGGGNSGSSLAGRLAAQVPRYATVELTEDYNAPDPKQVDEAKSDGETKSDVDAMDVEEEEPKTDQDDNHNKTCHQFTMAEPFAIADPTLGKISTDFDPNKVTFLTLQLDIEKPSTGFCISSCLEPMTTTTIERLKEEKKKKQKGNKEEEEKEKDDKDQEEEDHHLPDDEQVLVSLQHSLFCAKLFEAIRQEIMGQDADEDESAQAKQQRTALQQAQNNSNHSVVWLSSEQEEHFLPPPSVMVQSSGAPLCVVHCHASEVKVQMDKEYTLRAKLVEADEQKRHHQPPQPSHSSSHTTTTTTPNHNDHQISGSQTPAQLLVLCRSLLLHAQEAYHKHSLKESEEAAERQREEEAKKLEAAKPRGLDRIQKKDVRKQPKILQSVVGLGTKLLFEQRIRKVLVRVRHWLKTKYPNCKETLKCEWLSLSLFDHHCRFVLSFGNTLTVDVKIVRDEMTITTDDPSTVAVEGTSGAVRKVMFHSDSEFEIFLKLELRRQLRRTTQPVAAAAAPPIPVQ